jgi:hypothetical protein
MPEEESVPAINDPIGWYDVHADEAVGRCWSWMQIIFVPLASY